MIDDLSSLKTLGSQRRAGGALCVKCSISHLITGTGYSQAHLAPEMFLTGPQWIDECWAHSEARLEVRKRRGSVASLGMAINL